MRFLGSSIFTVVLFSFSAGICEQQTTKVDFRAQILSSDHISCVLSFDLSDVSEEKSSENDETFTSFTISGEGTTYEPERPLLPAVSRFVVVPPQAGLELVARGEGLRRIEAEHPPLCLNDERVGPVLGRCDSPDQALYPPVIAEMSEPFIIRGVRLVKITTYPIQYEHATNSYIQYDHVQTEIRYNDDPPVNPVVQPVRRNRSQQFKKFIRAVAINGDQVGRDDPDLDEEPPYIGHYLIVTHPNCLQYAAEFIEWRRKSGYKVDILQLIQGQAGNSNQVKDLIEERYDEYLDNGIDPFDHLLLIGDRRQYDNGGFQAQWILAAPVGNSCWISGPEHADYEYALLEGGNNDRYPDVAISRLPSGSETQMNLAIGRTMAYEAEPYMEETEWFTRGGVYSQHWGNQQFQAWHITVHTNVRWGEEVLQYLGFDEVRFYEDYNYDQQGQRVGPFVQRLYNDGCNLLLGRAENYLWQNNFNGVNENVVFPIRLVISGHGEWCAWSSFRAYGNDRVLRGPVATTNGWGSPPTAPMSAIWLELVNGVLLKDLTLGWGRNLGITMIETYFPNFQWNQFRAQPLYLHVKTDVDCSGDPGIQPWIGVPRIVEAEIPESISPVSRLIEVAVTDPDGEEVPGARVTFYDPGDMPDFNNNAYADYEGMMMRTTLTDSSGMVRFVFSDESEFEGESVYVTVTGRDIRPWFGEIEVQVDLPLIEIEDFSLTETEGNEDNVINPAETFTLGIVARNLGDDEPIEDVTAVIISNSLWVEVDENEISFGDIAAGETSEGDEPVTIHISPSCPDAGSRPVTQPVLKVDFHSGENSWNSAIKLNPVAPNFEVRRVVGGVIIPVGAHELDIELENRGGMDSPPVEAQIVTMGMGVSAVRETVVFPEIDADEFAAIEGESFLIAGNRIAIPGSENEMMLILTNENGFQDTAYFSLQVGEPREGAPQGPDGYGYICFDDSDEDWDIAPEYEWTEICPDDDDRDFDGTTCDFDDNVPEDIGESEVVPLGFMTRFYGHEYEEITIASNGFIAMGNQERITNFQNWPMDRAIGGGLGMIAPLWDNLRVVDNSGVYYYHDEDNARFIIEWYRLRHRSGGNSDLNFQVILYDADVWITETGDQIIIFQYKNVSNVRGQSEGMAREKNTFFASVGISSPDGTTGISYTWDNEYPVTSAPLHDRMAILFATSPRFKSGYLFGRVTDAATGQPIQDANVFTEHGFTTTTDEDGNWQIIDALAEVPFDITAMRQGYNDSTYIDTFLVEDDTLEINFDLLHPEFIPSSELLATLLDPDRSREMQFRLTNTGNGPLDWRVERRLLGDANADPWEYRRGYNVGAAMEDDWILGVVFLDSLIYVSGSNNNNPTIYIFDMNGELVDTLAQLGEDDRGMRDLAYDGELIWACSGDVVYGFTPEGEERASFDAPYRPTMHITYDSDREILWMASTTTNIVAYDREGNELDIVLQRNDLRIYGLAYWKDDPDDYPLYVFNRDRETNMQALHKYNPVTGERQFVTFLVPEGGGNPAGAFITNEFDVYSWVLMTISSAPRNDTGDRVDIWQLDARKDWFMFDMLSDTGRVEASYGRIESGDWMDYILNLDATGLPQVLFQGELRFYHNAAGGVTPIRVRLDVIGPVPPTAFSLAEPSDGDTLRLTKTTFSWFPSWDPNAGEDVAYNLWIETDGDSVGMAVIDTAFSIDLDTLGLEYDENFIFEWWINAISDPDTVQCDQRFSFLYLPSDIDYQPTLPVRFELSSVHPNPFNAATTVRFGIDAKQPSSLKVHDITGREVIELFSGVPDAGYYQARWNAVGMPSGIYLIRLSSGEKTQVRKVALIR